MQWTAKRMAGFGAVAFLVLVIIGYTLFQARAIIQGPTITLLSPADGMTVDTAFINIVGTVQYAKSITLQGHPIFIDLHGRFFEQLLLMEGYNIIEISAMDAQGRTERKIVRVVYKPHNRAITS